MYSVLLSAFVAVAAASPALYGRQYTNTSSIASYNATTSTASYNSTSSTATASTTTCVGGVTLTTGAGPTVTPDTASAFLANAQLSSFAVAAAVPSGYVSMFTNIQASNNAPGYLGSASMGSYNVSKCAALCSSTAGCASFNIYFERDPLISPGSGSGCTNPSSTTSITCAFWSSAINTANALNVGQYRADFHVVIAGANGYMNASIAAAATYNTPTYLNKAAIVAPYNCNNASTYLGVSVSNTTTFDATACAVACSATKSCTFFNAYLWQKNNVTLSQHCALYTQPWSSVFATNVGQYNAAGDHYTISSSYSYALTGFNGTCAH